MIYEIAYAMLSGAGIIFAALVAISVLVGVVVLLVTLFEKSEDGAFLAVITVLWMITSAAVYFTRAAGME